MRGIVAIVIASAGCSSTHTSTLPPYVQQLQVAPDRINMVQCRITFTHEVTDSFFFGRDEKRDLKEGPCWQTLVPTTVVGTPAPPPGGAP